MFPLENAYTPSGDHPGTFGYNRKHDIHCGIDLYTIAHSKVFAIEDGVVVKCDVFTGPQVNLPWWNETWAVMIEGQSGVINYGELKPCCSVGQKIQEGDVIGEIIPVLFEDKLRSDIVGHSCSMLHLELYKSGYRGDFAVWDLGKPCPEGLLDPTILLK